MENNKIILITKKTRLEDLIFRYNTLAQAKFYIESLGANFDEYVKEHEVYQKAIHSVQEILCVYGRLHVIDRNFLPSFIFGKNDLVVAIGGDGLVVNTLKYLSDHLIIGVNPDPERHDGILLPFKVEDLKFLIPQVWMELRSVKEITMAKITLNDRQTLYAVNDFFIGHKTHVSARYEIDYADQHERQSSSGIIVSTGFGSTGWLKSILTGTSKLASSILNQEIKVEKKIPWDAKSLFFSVREPFPSQYTKAEIVFGEISSNKSFSVLSQMPENGVIFSDGIEADYLAFNSGTRAIIEVADKKGNLVI